MKSLRIIYGGITAGMLCSTQVGLAADQKPAWLTDLSVGIKESYDDNVFAAGADAKYLPSACVVPAGSLAALKDQSSWVTTVSPKVAINFAPLLGEPEGLQHLSLTYAPDFVRYHDQSSEDYEAHRLTSSVKGRTGAFSFAADNAFTFINGSEMGVVYPGSLYNVYTHAAVRERREQMQDKATVMLQYDLKHGFIRPVAAFTYYDLMTKQVNVPGYQNYSDRYDVNGGADIGLKVSQQLALTLGYRYGHQYQEQFDFSPYSSPSDYQRVLLGIEGQPWSWLDVKIQGGPDFRNYSADTATHITPVDDRNLTTYYAEAVLTATITTNDTVTFKYKQWQWLSSTGKLPCFDSTFDLGYHRKLSAALGFDLGGKILSADYSSGNLATCRRDDLEYVVTTGVSYAVNSHFSVNLAYSLELGRNDMAGIVNEDTREFTRNLVTLGALLKF